MKKEINGYIKELEKLIKNNKVTDKVKEDLLIKIGFYQHERLIHLLVTILFAILTVICTITVLFINNISLLILLFILLFLLIPYIFHYYYLENSVQYLYKIYDKIK